MRFARGVGRVVVVPLFRVCVCEVLYVMGLLGVECESVGEIELIEVSWNCLSASLPPCNLQIVEALCAVGANCNVHNWCVHGFVVEGRSQSWHVHPSSSMASEVAVGVGRQYVWTQRKHRSHCIRSGSAESPSP